MPNITPVSFPFFGDAVKLSTYVEGFPTDSDTCTIQYFLLTQDNQVVYKDSYRLTPEEFQLWGQDNTYLDEIAADRIPVTIIP